MLDRNKLREEQYFSLYVQGTSVCHVREEGRTVEACSGSALHPSGSGMRERDWEQGLAVTPPKPQ